MNQWWRSILSFFTGKCLYYDHCSLYQSNSVSCNEETGSYCGACRMFDELGESCKHYKK